MATGSKAVIKNADMSEEMQSDAIDCATQVRGRRWEAGAWVCKGELKGWGVPCDTARQLATYVQDCNCV